jgi:hypothetical protein
MEEYLLGIVIGAGIGALLTYAYYHYYYFLVDVRKIDPSFIKMWNNNMGYFTLSFILNPPKPDLYKPAPKKAKLTLIKETKND